MQACTQWNHSDVWSQLPTTPECLFKIGDQQSEKKLRNCDRRVICNATRGIDAGRGVICHRGVSDGSDGARPLWRSHSAQTEMFFADDRQEYLNQIFTLAVVLCFSGDFLKPLCPVPNYQLHELILGDLTACLPKVQTYRQYVSSLLLCPWDVPDVICIILQTS